MKRPGKQLLAINFDRVDPTPSVHCISELDGWFFCVREISLKSKDNAVDNGDV